MAQFKAKLYHSIRPMFTVQNVASSKRKIQTLFTVSNVSEFEMKIGRACHLHDNNFYEVITIHAYGSVKNDMELCEYCIRRMWKEAWLHPSTKKILEELMRELKIYDS